VEKLHVVEMELAYVSKATVLNIIFWISCHYDCQASLCAVSQSQAWYFGEAQAETHLAGKNFSVLCVCGWTVLACVATAGQLVVMQWEMW